MDPIDKALRSVFRDQKHEDLDAIQDELIPDSIGGYRVTAVLGRGGMGVVYRAIDAKLGRPIAVKVIARRFAGDAVMVGRFVEEARICSQLQHPGIVPIHEIGTLPDGRNYFSMKVIEGETFADLLDQRTSTTDDSARFVEIFRKVCQAIAYAHTSGVHHGDLKPGNIMIGAFGEVQVLDWGFARRRTEGVHGLDADDLSGLMGTPAFMSPEQARGRPQEVDERSDVFTLGGILCEILTGEPPYTGNSRHEISCRAAGAQLDQTHARLAACGASAALVELVRWCLAPSPEHRPRDASLVASEIDNYIESIEGRARELHAQAAASEARASEEKRSRRLQRALAVSAIVILLVASAGLLAWVSSNADARAARLADIAGEMENAVLLRERARSQPLHDASRWSLALKATRRVQASASSADVDDSLRSRIEALVAELTMADSAAEPDRVMLYWLEHVMPHLGDDLDMGAVRDTVLDAFAGHGLDLRRANVEELVRQLRTSAIATPLARGLDALIRLQIRQVPEPGPLAHKLCRLTNLADPDTQRVAIRRALLARDGQALQRLAEGYECNRSSAVTVSMLAASLVNVGRRDAAVKLLRRSVFEFPDDFRISHDLGSLLRQRRLPSNEATQLASMGVALHPKSSHALADLAQALMHAGEHAKAEELLVRVRELDPGYRRAWHYAANLANRQGRWQIAKDAAREALALDPDDIWSHRDMAVALVSLGEDLAAVPHLRKVLEQSPRDSIANRYMARVALWRGWLDTADTCLAQVSVDATGGGVAVINRAAVLLRRGRFEKALSHLRQAKELRDESGAPRLAEHAVQISTLQKHAQRCLKLAPGFERHLRHGIEARALEASCEMGFVAYARGEPAASVDVYSRVPLDDPEWSALGLYGHRLWAACAAGRLLREGAVSDESELRSRAYRWLKDGLRVAVAGAESRGAESVAFLRSLVHIDDLKPFRQLSNVPSDEAPLWRELWSDAESLLRRLE